MGISQPARGTNDDILFIIDHLHADEEDADKEAEEGTTSLIDQYRDELEAYKKLPKRTMGNCPLKWWRDRNHRFPTLSKLAQINLCIPVASAPSRRIFSMASRLISNIRCRLLCKTDGMIFLINQNMELLESLNE